MGIRISCIMDTGEAGYEISGSPGRPAVGTACKDQCAKDTGDHTAAQHGNDQSCIQINNQFTAAKKLHDQTADQTIEPSSIIMTGIYPKTGIPVSRLDTRGPRMPQTRPKGAPQTRPHRSTGRCMGRTGHRPWEWRAESWAEPHIRTTHRAVRMHLV